MLINFSVQNFLSFKEETAFSLVASTEENHPDHVFRGAQKLVPDILDFSIIYGANGSGKSNLVKCLQFFQNLILIGTKPRSLIKNQPFRLSKASQDQVSKFDITFFYKEKIYNYGCTLTKEKIHSEWLFLLEKNKTRQIFYRETVDNERIAVEPGPILARKKSKKYQFIEFVAQGTRPNQLFLSEADNKNVDVISPVVEWFEKVLSIIPANSLYSNLETRAAREKNFSNQLSQFLKAAGTGISGLTAKKKKFDLEKVSNGKNNFETLKDALERAPETTFARINESSVLTKNGNEDTYYLINLVSHHESMDGEQVEFPFSVESDGTKRLTNLIPALLHSMKETQVYIIDELDRSLHPLLSKFFIEQFFKCNKKKKSQIICTTHDTNLLDLNLLRRDEIWFIEKDDHGSSHLTSFLKFKFDPKKDLQKGYLLGRFGAIPIFGDINRLGWDSNGCKKTQEDTSN